MILRAALLVVFATGCVSPDPAPALPPAAPESTAVSEVPSASEAPTDLEGEPSAGGPSVLLDGEGLRLLLPSTRTVLLAFGDNFEDVTAAAARAQRSTYGDDFEPYVGPVADCSAGPLDAASSPDGFTLYGRDGLFVGWSLVDTEVGGSTLTTMGGLGLGTTRADLEAGPTTVDVSDVTSEFTTAGIEGILDSPDADGVVVHLWAGASCAYL